MAEEFRLVTDDVSSSLWELMDKELAVKRQRTNYNNPKEFVSPIEASDLC